MERTSCFQVNGLLVHNYGYRLWICSSREEDTGVGSTGLGVAIVVWWAGNGIKLMLHYACIVGWAGLVGMG